MTAGKFIILALILCTKSGVAADERILTAVGNDGRVVSYIFNYENLKPRFIMILFPGGDGVVDPRHENGKLLYGSKNNFLIRSRGMFVDGEFATVATSSKYPPAKPGALFCEPLKAAMRGR